MVTMNINVMSTADCKISVVMDINYSVLHFLSGRLNKLLVVDDTPKKYKLKMFSHNVHFFFYQNHLNTHLMCGTDLLIL